MYGLFIPDAPLICKEWLHTKKYENNVESFPILVNLKDKSKYLLQVAAGGILTLGNGLRYTEEIQMMIRGTG